MKESKCLGLYIAIHISRCYMKCKTGNLLFIQRLKANNLIYVTETVLHNLSFKKPLNYSFEEIKESLLKFQKILYFPAKL